MYIYEKEREKKKITQNRKETKLAQTPLPMDAYAKTHFLSESMDATRLLSSSGTAQPPLTGEGERKRRLIATVTRQLNICLALTSERGEASGRRDKGGGGMMRRLVEGMGAITWDNMWR